MFLPLVAILLMSTVLHLLIATALGVLRLVPLNRCRCSAFPISRLGSNLQSESSVVFILQWNGLLGLNRLASQQGCSDYRN